MSVVAEDLIRELGPEIHGWLAAAHGPCDADEIFGMFSEAVARSCGTNEGSGYAPFRGDASARTWAYALARTSALRFRRAAARRHEVLTPLDHHPSALDLGMGTRHRVGWGARTTDAHDQGPRLAALRAQLTVEERELLVLRIDRELPFRDIARILHDGTAPREEDLDRLAARHRKRFEALRARLRQMAAAP